MRRSALALAVAAAALAVAALAVVVLEPNADRARSVVAQGISQSSPTTAAQTGAGDASPVGTASAPSAFPSRPRPTRGPTTTRPPRPTTTSSTRPPVVTSTVPAGGGSAVEGTVLFSPVCPVERTPPDPACAPRPGPADIRLTRSDGSLAAQGSAGADGRFLIAVPPGRYHVGASSGSRIGGGCQSDPADVTVPPGAHVSVRVACDTGIR